MNKIKKVPAANSTKNHQVQKKKIVKIESETPDSFSAEDHFETIDYSHFVETPHVSTDKKNLVGKIIV